MPATPNAISSQANQGKRFFDDSPLTCFLTFALPKNSSAGPSPPPSPVYIEQLDRLVTGKTGISAEPGRQTFGHLALMARNNKHDRSIILVTLDNMAICLMVYILASLLKDFNNLARPSNQQSHVGSFAYAHNLTFSYLNIHAS